MKKILLGLMAVLLLSACGNKKTNDSAANQEQEETKVVVSQDKETTQTVAVPTGTWMDLKTGEVMVFSENEVYWAKQPGVAFTALGVKSKEDGKIQVYFENKPDQLYDMTFDLEQADDKMQCLKGGKKLNDYEKLSDNTKPELAFEKMREDIGYVDDAPMKYESHNLLKTTDDPRMLMLYLHTPLKYWTAYPAKTKSGNDLGAFNNCYGAVKLKLKNGNVVALIRGEAAGDMQYNCNLVTLALNEDYLAEIRPHVQHHNKAWKCGTPDFWQVQKMYLDGNGDLLVDMEIKDVFDNFDEMQNSMDAEMGKPKDKLRKEIDLLVNRTVRIDGNYLTAVVEPEKEESKPLK